MIGLLVASLSLLIIVLAVGLRSSDKRGRQRRASANRADTDLLKEIATTYGAEVRAIETILQLRDPRWKAIVEAPVPGPGRRSSDLRLDHVPDVVLIEFESRVTHWEEILRKCHEKREAVVASLDPDRQVHVVLAMSPSRRHRALVREHPGMIRAAFPVPAADIDRALRNADRPFPGDGLLWVAGGT